MRRIDCDRKGRADEVRPFRLRQRVEAIFPERSFRGLSQCDNAAARPCRPASRADFVFFC